MNLKNKISVKKIIVSILILLMMLFISKASVAIADKDKYWFSEGTGDTQINGQLFNSSGKKIVKRVSELKAGEDYYITGWAGDSQIFRSRAIFCTQKEKRITVAQDGKKKIQYKINKIAKIKTDSNHNSAEKGLAYIVSLQRKSAFTNYNDSHTEEPVQNAFWIYTNKYKNNLGNVLPKIGGAGDSNTGNENIGTAKQIYEHAENYKKFIEVGINNSPKITINGPETKWINDYKEFQIKYNLSYNNIGGFGEVTEVIIKYKGNDGKEKSIAGTKANGENTIKIAERDIYDSGCEFTIAVTYKYTYVEATICDFSNPKGTGQNLVIASGNKELRTKTGSAKGKIPTKLTDVSMQKYITKVNGKALTTNEANLRNRKNTYSRLDKKVVAKVEENNMQANTYKGNSVVNIEAGDEVEYTIEVYNNGLVPTTVTLADKMINTGKITHVVKDNQEIKLSEIAYPKESNDNQENYREGNICTFVLPKGAKTIFKITVKYGVYNIYYSNNDIINKAWITTSPKNNTIYRTQDEDYIKMRKYKVSLEKWVSNVNNEENSDFNVTNEFMDVKYPYLIAYLNGRKDSNVANLENSLNKLLDYLKIKCKDLDEKKLEYIINNNGQISYTDGSYLKADLNNDKKVDFEDLNIVRANEIYKKLGKDAIKIIEKYIKADLDNNGIVNNDDFTIYKVLKLDLYDKLEINEQGLEEQSINKRDLYMFILKKIYNNGKFNKEGLDYIRIKSISNDAKFEQNKTQAKEDILSYIQSDLNGDGIVDREDYCNIYYDKYIFFDYGIKRYYLVDEITEEIKNINTLDDINELYRIINKYDLDNNLAINANDIEILKEYNAGKYRAIEEWENGKSEEEKNKLLEYIESKLVVAKNNENAIFDLDNNGQIDIEDVEWCYQYYEENDRFVKDILNILIVENDTGINFNNNGNISYADYELVKEYENIKGKVKDKNITENEINEIIEKYNIFNEDSSRYEDDSELIDFSYKDIYGIETYRGIRLYNRDSEGLDVSLYDFNEDGIINQDDINLIDAIKEADFKYINKIDINDFRKFFQELLKSKDDSVKILEKLNIDINDSNNVDDKDFELLQGMVNSIDKEKYKLILQQKDSYKSISEVNYNWYIDGIMKYSKEDLDVNEDGIIDESDIKYLEIYNNNEIDSTKIISRDYIEQILLKDTNKDEVFDKNDNDFIIECINAIKNKTYDINEDNIYDDIDLNLYLETNKLIKHNNDQQYIINYFKNKDKRPNQNCSDRYGKAIHKYDNDINTKNDTKFNNVVEVKKGDYVTYTIEVKNDGTVEAGDASVYISEILDNLPEGVTDKLDRTADKLIFTNLKDVLLRPGESAKFNLTVMVTEPNMSVEVLENTAEIIKIENKNNVVVQDSTPNNNKDSDYIQLEDITISGFVWNDRATNKGNNNYNGLYKEDDNDKRLGKTEEIEVKLCRGETVVSSKYIKDDGTYTFSAKDIGRKYYKKSEKYDVIPMEDTEKHIKGPKKTNSKPWTGEKGNYTSRWNGNHYSYYIVFEYDGITYTSTPDGKTYVSITDTTAFNNENYKINSNAKEDNGKVKETRGNFNNRFSTINNTKGIKYTTKNDKGYIPQSNHVYDNENMAMQSSTDLIKLSDYKNNPNLEEQLGFVNLGLRGRDIFDLELTSDVSKVEVTVNGQKGVYTDTNKVNIRNSDFPDTEDMANKVNEEIEENVTEYDKPIRNTDLNTELTDANYDKSQGLSEIKVTYKITVTNASQTEGTATVITDYYDKCYSNPTAYIGNEDGEKIENIIKGTKYDNYNNRYNKVEITLPENYLTQSESNYLYITFEMDVAKLRTSFANKNELKYPTYNMAEITEYKTKSYVGTSESDKEYTRGLLDKDSAPGSIEREQVRTTETEGQNTVTTGGNPTTLQYYFEGKDLTKLKYEDDTYATPTLYFISNDSIEGRKITGTVFEDYTVIYGDKDRIKSGNGIQDGETGEPGIKGITVELIEKTNDSGEVKRYSTTTEKDGKYTFTNFLPGNYIIKYSYGDTEDTFIVNENNSKSYNGEDFQATNNTGSYNSGTLNNESKPNYWYAYNEKVGVSTATDNTGRREEVSENVTGFTDLEMQVLNNARDGQKDATVTGIEGDSNKEITITTGEIIEDTKMWACTPTFNMTVEKTEIDKDNKPNPKTAFSTYEVSNMNFGIAEVPVTTIDLQKTIKSFTIRDSADQNDIAKIYKDEDNYSVAIRPLEITKDKKQRAINGLVNILEIDATTACNAVWSNGEDKNVIGIGDNFEKEKAERLKNYLIENSINRGVIITHGWKVGAGDVSAPAGATQIVAQIQDEKLQGAKLQITYEITASMYTERNFDSTGTTQASIKGVIDYIDNDLSYNEELGKNNEFWEVTSYEKALETYKEAKYECKRNGETVTVTPKGTLDPEGKKYTTIVKAKEGNPLLIEDVGTSAPVEITLEKILSSTDSSIMDIITSNIDSYEYDNNIEIAGLNYTNTEVGGEAKRDRIRTPERYIILAGSQHDSFSAEKFSIIPPTGENRSMNYFILAVIALGVLAIGIGGIRKFVVKK